MTVMVAMAQDEQPTSLSWSNLSLSVTINKQEKVLIKNMAGSVKAGEVVGILGGSGMFFDIS